jgi:hypothetical protein
MRTVVTWCVTLAAGVLAGCGSGESYVWQKEGATQADLQRDSFDCEATTRAAAASFSRGLQGAGEAQAFGQRCMAAKGWSLQQLGPDRKATLAPIPPSYFRNVQCRFSNPPQVLPGTAGFCIREGGQIVEDSSS